MRWKWNVKFCSRDPLQIVLPSTSISTLLFLLVIFTLLVFLLHLSLLFLVISFDYSVFCTFSTFFFFLFSLSHFFTFSFFFLFYLSYNQWCFYSICSAAHELAAAQSQDARNEKSAKASPPPSPIESTINTTNLQSLQQRVSLWCFPHRTDRLTWSLAHASAPYQLTLLKLYSRSSLCLRARL